MVGLQSSPCWRVPPFISLHVPLMSPAPTQLSTISQRAFWVWQKNPSRLISPNSNSAVTDAGRNKEMHFLSRRFDSGKKSCWWDAEILQSGQIHWFSLCWGPRCIWILIWWRRRLCPTRFRAVKAIRGDEWLPLGVCPADSPIWSPAAHHSPARPAWTATSAQAGPNYREPSYFSSFPFLPLFCFPVQTLTMEHAAPEEEGKKLKPRVLSKAPPRCRDAASPWVLAKARLLPPDAPVPFLHPWGRSHVDV